MDQAQQISQIMGDRARLGVPGGRDRTVLH
jgi:hypothetical protein